MTAKGLCTRAPEWVYDFVYCSWCSGAPTSLLVRVLARTSQTATGSTRGGEAAFDPCDRNTGVAAYAQVFPKRKMQNFYKSLAWYTKYSQKINRITQMDCKLRDESNEPN